MILFTTLLGSMLIGCSENFNRFTKYCLNAQQNIISSLEALEADIEGKTFSNTQKSNSVSFLQEPWEKFSNDSKLVGHGITAVIEKSLVIEKGAVSTTIISGKLSPERASAISNRGKSVTDEIKVNAGDDYFACALSIVLHSKSPMVPTFRSDIRYFEVQSKDSPTKERYGWFGGGADLTPYYLFDEDAKEFHSCYKSICDQYASHQSHDANLYQELKEYCDRYFFIPARNEHRGIGGIFFDDLASLYETQSNCNSIKSTENAMAFTCKVCDSFMPSYISILRRRWSLPFTAEQRHWQLIRRGRYVEFNLLYDRGVKFGLVPGGRTEAVLVSCPPLVAWDYNYKPPKGGEEERLTAILKTPQDWC